MGLARAGRLIAVLSAAVIALCATAATASASTTGSSDTSATVGLGADFSTGQSFTVPNVMTDTFFHSLTITGYRGVNTTSHIVVSAVDGSGLPTGPALFTSPTLPVNAGFTPVTVYPNLTLNPNQQYAFYAAPTASAGGNAFEGSSTNVYAGGQVVSRHLMEPWSGFATQDIAFLASFNTGAKDSLTTISCPGPGKVGVATSCSATLKDANSGTGLNGLQVVLSTLSSTGAFSGSCFVNASGNCSFDFTPSQAGSETLFGQFIGDGTHLGSGTNTGLSVDKRDSDQTGAGCSPATLHVGETATCFVTVSDTDSGTKTTPTGTTSWNSTGTGSFAGGGSCGLAPDTLGVAKCVSIAYTPTAPGSHQITSVYSGDATHLAGMAASAGTLTVQPSSATVPPPAPDCSGVLGKISSLKKKLRKAHGQKRKQLKKKLRKLRAQATGLGC